MGAPDVGGVRRLPGDVVITVSYTRDPFDRDRPRASTRQSRQGEPIAREQTAVRCRKPSRVWRRSRRHVRDGGRERCCGWYRSSNVPFLYCDLAAAPRPCCDFHERRWQAGHPAVVLEENDEFVARGEGADCSWATVGFGFGVGGGVSVCFHTYNISPGLMFVKGNYA